MIGVANWLSPNVSKPDVVSVVVLKGKRQSKAKVGVANLHMMEAAGLKHKVADPRWRELHLVAEQHAVIV